MALYSSGMLGMEHLLCKEVVYFMKRAPESVKHDAVCIFSRCSYVLYQRLPAVFNSGNPAQNRKLSTFIFGCGSH